MLCFASFSSTQAQYVCDYEYKVTNKQRRKLKRKCKKVAITWYKNHRDSLKISSDLTFSKLKYQADEDEYEKWAIVDTLLCNNERKNNIELAKQKMKELGLAVFDIRAYFHHPEELNPKIRSILYFQFDIHGKMLRAIVRRKEMSPTSEIYYH